jgi:hypothetical protein
MSGRSPSRVLIVLVFQWIPKFSQIPSLQKEGDFVSRNPMNMQASGWLADAKDRVIPRLEGTIERYLKRKKNR